MHGRNILTYFDETIATAQLDDNGAYPANGMVIVKRF